MQLKISILILFLSAFVSLSYAQSVVGFWHVSSVQVGDRSLTPVAKWFKNKSDGRYQSGNGWTQNSYGTWIYNEKTNEFSLENQNSIKDEFGAFAVQFRQDSMIWERVEEGMKVVVTLVPIDEMPKAPADEIKGLWKLESVVKDGEESIANFDPNGKQYFLIRPDMQYRLRNPNESFQNGIWHMDMHRPECTFVNNNRNEKDQFFTVSFEQDKLLMQDKELTIYTYKRIFEIPE